MLAALFLRAMALVLIALTAPTTGEALAASLNGRPLAPPISRPRIRQVAPVKLLDELQLLFQAANRPVEYGPPHDQIAMATNQAGYSHDQIYSYSQVPDNFYGSQTYGQGSQMYGQGSQTYGQGSEAYVQGSHTYGQGSQTYGQGSQTYGQGSEAYEQGSDTYGQGSHTYGQDSGTYEQGSHYGQGGQLYGQGGQLYGQGGQLYGQGGQLYGQGSQLLSSLERLDQVISGLDNLASVVPIGQSDSMPHYDFGVVDVTTTEPPNVPIIDPGLFVIQGVQTCGNETGYCMLGSNCSTDVDFLEDVDGHCRGLLSAFSPPADFICCSFNPEGRRTSYRTTPTTTVGVTFDDGLVDSIVNFEEHNEPDPSDESSQIVDIVAIITDSTGIVDIVTRPYTGPWPLTDDGHGEAVTLPFAKPGETFPAGSLVGLSQDALLAQGTTPVPNTVEEDSFHAGDLPPVEEQEDADILADTMITVAPATVRPTTSTTSAPPDTTKSTLTSPAADVVTFGKQPTVKHQEEQLGPLAAVPVMSHDLDYIGDVDYDQHLLPALMPIRPGSIAADDSADLQTDGSGEVEFPDEPFTADFFLPLDVQELHEGSGEAVFSQAEQPSADEGLRLSELHLKIESVEDTVPPAIAGQIPDADDRSEMADAVFEDSLSKVEQLEPVPNVPQCGVMGSSLASLLARSHHSGRTLDESDGDHEEGEAHVTSTVVWCWMAAVMRRTWDPNHPLELVCAGTLVEQDMVLTSAGCASRLSQQPLRDFVVLLGASSLHTTLDYGTQRIELQEVIVHEDYELMDDVHVNDISMIKLAKRAETSRTVCRLCLPPENMELQSRQSCTATGYGMAGSDNRAKSDVSGDDMGVLRQVTLPVVPSGQCSAVQQLSYRHPHVQRQNFICAAGRTAIDAACFRVQDGGSPVACMASSGLYYLHGLVSRDADCSARLLGPRVYTNVASYYSWIRANYERTAPPISPSVQHS